MRPLQNAQFCFSARKMKIKPAEYIAFFRIIIFIFRGNWAKVGIMQRSHDDCETLIDWMQGQCFYKPPHRFFWIWRAELCTNTVI
jgi:hypothetical protein